MISEHEATALARVCMEIQEHLQAVILLGLLHDSLARRPNRRIVRLGRVQVHSVQVARHSVQPVVAAGDAVRVQHHDDFEDVGLAQALALLTAQIAEHFEKAVENVAARGLTRMHSRCQEDYWLFLPEA